MNYTCIFLLERVASVCAMFPTKCCRVYFVKMFGKGVRCSSFRVEKERMKESANIPGTFLSRRLKMSVKVRRFNLVMRCHWENSKELERRAFYVSSCAFIRACTFLRCPFRGFYWKRNQNLHRHDILLNSTLWISSNNIHFYIWLCGYSKISLR